ncbi:hypothetical protein HPG69_017559, partial [Diceros bicornis minor]
KMSITFREQQLSVPSKHKRFIKLVFRIILYKNWFVNTLSLFVQALPQEIYRELSKGKIHYCHDVLVISFNELSDTRAKFHILFLFFVSTMFFISVLSLFSYHCWLVGKNRTTIESFRAPTFSYGPDGNGFSLGYSKNWRQVFGDEKKYWLLPIFSSLGDGCSFPTRLVGMDPEQASISNQNEYARSVGSNQPFPVKPLSESKNRLLDSESQWIENGSEEGIVRS